MPTAPLILYERTGSWAVAWRRALAVDRRLAVSRDRMRIVETRSIAECREVLSSCRVGFVALELTEASCHDVLELLLSMGQGSPAVKAAVLAERAMGCYEWLARELGAVHFVTSPRRLAPLVGVAWHHLQQLPLTAETTSERIWASLPWTEIDHDRTY